MIRSRRNVPCRGWGFQHGATVAAAFAPPAILVNVAPALVRQPGHHRRWFCKMMRIIWASCRPRFSARDKTRNKLSRFLYPNRNAKCVASRSLATIKCDNSLSRISVFNSCPTFRKQATTSGHRWRTIGWCECRISTIYPHGLNARIPHSAARLPDHPGRGWRAGATGLVDPGGG